MFLIHGLDGTVTYYKELARLVDSQCTVYGIQAQGLQNGEWQDDISEILASYLKEIKIVQPHGPYILGGYCAGTRLAYELVRILEDEGEVINRLILLNPYPFISESDLKRLRAKGLIKRSVRKVKIGNREISSEPESIFEADGVSCTYELASLEKSSNREKIREHIHHTVIKAYRAVRLIETPIYVISADEREEALPLEHFERLTYGQLNVQITLGGHHSMFYEQNIRELGERFVRVLEM